MSGAGSGLPPEAYLLALASLPFADHTTLRRLVRDRSPEAAWAAIVGGRIAGPALHHEAQGIDPAQLWARHRQAGVAVLTPDGADFPELLAADPEPPPVLLRQGQRPDAVDAAWPRVGIIGTRRCTPYGREVAAELARDLAGQGVVVVSGLAAGIDGAAHHGALDSPPGAAPPVAVVGSGLDVAYPRQNASLWQRVRDAGVLLSEAPLGCRPERWRFPARNRLIASLSSVLVVVESHAAGGSMHTVRAAIDRGVPVMAVPGSIRSPASAGTNQLLAEGVAPVTGVDDVMVALSLERAGTQPRLPLPPVPVGDPGTVLEALGWEPADLDGLIRRTGLSMPKAALALSALEVGGLVTCEGGWWRRT